MPDHNTVSTLLGVLCSVLLFAGIIAKKHLAYEAIGFIAGVFVSGTNIIPSLYICYFSLTPDLSSTLPVALKGYEKYLALAGICSCLVSIISIITLFKKGLGPDSAPPTGSTRPPLPPHGSYKVVSRRRK